MDKVEQHSFKCRGATFNSMIKFHARLLNTERGRLFTNRVCVFARSDFIVLICFDTEVEDYGRASWRASDGATDRARPRGLADGSRGPLQCRDEPQ